MSIEVKPMRVLNAVFALLMSLFALVQYNDPDPWIWGAAYGIAALWCALVSLRPAILRQSKPLRVLFAACLATAFGAAAWLWPTSDPWWRKDVIWESETVREALGLGIVVVALGFAAWGAWRDALKEKSR